MIKAMVGSGGKTSLIRRYASTYVKLGYKVFVTTSTHMYIEENTLLTDDADEIIRELEEKHYVMAGRKDNQKIKPLSLGTYHKVCQFADVVLIEADGSKQKPIKFPAAHEPVIYDNVDEIVVVCGLFALQRKVSEAAHRPELVKKCLNIEEDGTIDAPCIQKLVMKGYVEPLRKKYPEKKITIHPNHDGSLYQKALAAFLKAEMDVSMVKQERVASRLFGDFDEWKPKTGCVIMASGKSVRFGRDKLLEEFQGKTLIQRTLDLTGQGLFAKRVVVTRNEEVKRLCEEQHVDVIFHSLPGRNDTVRLGIEFMEGMDGCLFCPCDQPLLCKESIKRLLDAFACDKSKIFRLAYRENRGAPILFGKELFEELAALPPGCGGSRLVKKYQDRVEPVPALDETELFDIDTQEDYEWLMKKRRYDSVYNEELCTGIKPGGGLCPAQKK